MNVLFTVGDFGVTPFLAGTVLSILLAFVFGFVLRERKICGTAGAFGFALLPAVAMIRLFEEYTSGAEGIPVRIAFLRNTWFAADVYRINRMEAVVVLELFAALVFWVMLRKTTVKPDGDLLLVALALLGASMNGLGRLHAVNFIPALPCPADQVIGAALMLLLLLAWTIRALKQGGHGLMTLVCWVVFLLGLSPQTLLLWTDLTAGAELYDEIIVWVGLLLSLKALLCLGRVTRKVYLEEN